MMSSACDGLCPYVDAALCNTTHASTVVDTLHSLYDTVLSRSRVAKQWFAARCPVFINLLRTLRFHRKCRVIVVYRRYKSFRVVK